VLAGRISADAALADQAGNRGGIDDGAAARADHGGNLVFHGEKDALEIDVDQTAPGHLFFVFDGKSAGADAGIVERHLQPPVSGRGALDHAAAPPMPEPPPVTRMPRPAKRPAMITPSSNEVSAVQNAGIFQERFGRAGKADAAAFHHIRMMCNTERDVGELLDQEHTDAVARKGSSMTDIPQRESDNR
jgi:hypothetical protein